VTSNIENNKLENNNFGYFGHQKEIEKNKNSKILSLSIGDKNEKCKSKQKYKKNLLLIKTLQIPEVTEEKKLIMKLESLKTLNVNNKNRNKTKQATSRHHSSSSSGSESSSLSQSNSKSQKSSSNKNHLKTSSTKKLEDPQLKKNSSKLNNINIFSNFTCCCKNSNVSSQNNNNNININNNIYNSNNLPERGSQINNNDNNNIINNNNNKNNLGDNLDLNSNKFVFLVIDDNFYIRKSITNLINTTLKSLKKTLNFSADFEIIEGNDGIDALKYVIDAKIGSRIKAIFIDENMEYLNGSETVKLIRSFQSVNKINKFHIASVTAFEDPVTRQNVMNAGVNEIFPKPLSKSHLVDFFQRYKILV